jgi:uncharacterized protein DUF6644
MSTTEVLTVIQNSAVAHAISKSNHMVAASLQIVHVIGFILLLSSIVMISLRLLGLAFAQQPISKVGRDATRLIWIGLALTVASGTLMFVSSPRLYYYNPAFELKMLLLIAAVLIQVLLLRRVSASDSPTPALVRTTVALSLASWFGVGLAGRIIGFI